MNYEKIDQKYKIAPVGSYNRMVHICPSCDYDISSKTESYMDNIIGFASAPVGHVSCLECPNCFEKWHCHIKDDIVYSCFQHAIEDGTQKHFKS